MLKDTIEKFKEKHSGFNFEEFIQSYLDGESRSELCSRYNVSEMPLRGFLARLGLEFPKSRRYNSFEDFKYRISLENNITDVNALVEVENDVKLLAEDNRKLRKALVLARDSNNALRKEVRVEVRNEDIVDTILSKFEQQILSMEKVIVPLLPFSIVSDEIPKEGLVLVLGDAHWGSSETKEECGSNYNFDVAERRLNYMVEKTLTNPLQSQDLKVIELLDITKGILHQSEYLSEGGITGAMLKIVEVYSEVYAKVSSKYNNIDVIVTNSNHDRTTQWVSSHMKWDNFGIMIYKMIEMLLKAKGVNNITFKYTMKEHHLININSANIFVTHADAIRSYKAHSQAERAKVQAICLGMFGTHYKHMICGHQHQSIAASNEYGGYNIVNGTLVGNSTYGVSNGFASLQPVQTILFIDDKGDIEQLSFINLSHIQ